MSDFRFGQLKTREVLQASVSSTYSTERVEDELLLDHGGLHVGFALPRAQLLDVCLHVLGHLLGVLDLLDGINSGRLVIWSSDDPAGVIGPTDEVLLELVGDPGLAGCRGQLVRPEVLHVPTNEVSICLANDVGSCLACSSSRRSTGKILTEVL
jgi:hypothetical protein